MEREQFTFYSSFAKAIQRIRKATDRCAAYDAIVNYALYEKLPDLDSMPDAAAIAFELIRPNLDASRKKAANGKKGGKTGAEEKQEEEESKPEANRKQTASKKENEKEKEKEKENECYIPQTPVKRKEADRLVEEILAERSPRMREVMQEWLQYKREKKSSYQPTGLKQLLNKVNRKVGEYGEEKMIATIEESMSSNYQGIVWDWLEDKPEKPQAAKKPNKVGLGTVEERRAAHPFSPTEL